MLFSTGAGKMMPEPDGFNRQQIYSFADVLICSFLVQVLAGFENPAVYINPAKCFPILP